MGNGSNNDVFEDTILILFKRITIFVVGYIKYYCFELELSTNSTNKALFIMGLFVFFLNKHQKRKADLLRAKKQADAIIEYTKRMAEIKAYESCKPIRNSSNEIQDY